MKDWEIDKIIGAGLIVALNFYFIIVLVVTIVKGTVMPLDVASNIVTGLIGYMGKNLIDKFKSKDDKRSDLQ